MRFSVIFILFCAFFFDHSLHGQTDPIILKDGLILDISSGDNVLLEDYKTGRKISKASDISDDRLEGISMDFTVRNDNRTQVEWVIDYRKNDYVGVRVFKGEVEIERDTVGYLVPGRLKRMRRGNASSYIIPPGESRRFVVTLVKSAHPIQGTIQFYGIHRWLDKERLKMVYDLIFVTIVLIFGLYNIIFFINSRRNAYLYLGIYLLLVSLFFLFVTMLLRDYVLFDHPQFTLYFMVVALLAPLFHWRFIQSLVPTKTLIPKMDRVMEIAVMLCLVLAGFQLLLFLFNQPYKIISQITQYGILSQISISVVAYILLLRRKDVITNYFLYGTLLMVLGVFYDAFIWSEKSDLTIVSKVGFIAEIIFFSLGIGKKVSMETEERKHQLEELVTSRTSDLDRQKHFFARILNEVNSLVFVRDSDFQIVFCNEPYAKVFGHKPEGMIGKSMAEFSFGNESFIKKIRAQDNKILQGARDVPFYDEEQPPDGSDYWMRVIKKKVIFDGVPYLLGVLFDVSNLKDTEIKLQEANEQLKQKIDDLQNAEGKLIEFEKMASIGQLTSGLAHEIGNPVNYLAGNVQPLTADLNEMSQLVEMVEHNRSYLQQSAKGREMLKFFDEVDFHYTIQEIHQLMEGIEHGSNRVKTLVESFRDFSRADSDQMVLSDLNKAMMSTIRLVEHAVRDRIELEVDLDPDLPRIPCSVGQISQVFLNLINNAIQAIDDKGKISIYSWFDGSFAYFDIKDTGSGIAGIQLKKIFEPFFTTKEVGKGTGLGLAMSKNIVVRHGGNILVKSMVGKGSTFTVRLPKNISQQ